MYSSPTRKFTLLFIFSLILSLPLFGQTSTQRIKGRLLDQESGEPIVDAEIELMNYVPIKISTTNEFGEYELRGIPIGVHRFLIIHEQYQTLIVPDIEVVIEQPTLLNIKMKKEVFANSIGPVEKAPIKIQKRYTERTLASKSYLLNAVQIYHAEEQNRYAASREDVFQLLGNFEGVQPQAAYLNAVSIQGQSPLFTEFSIEGVKIQQLQHLQMPFNNIGYFSMLSPDRLDNFDLLKAGHSAASSGGIGGQVQAKLKTADLNKNHLSLKVSPLIVGISSEIPLNRKLGQSLALGYRHSSMQWLNSLIPYPFAEGAPSFQDGYFNVSLDRSRSGDYKVFGLFGQSTQNTSSSLFWPLQQDNHEIENKQWSAIFGARNKVRLAPKLYLNSLLAATHQQQNFSLKTPNNLSSSSYFQNQESNIQLETKFDHKINREHQLFIGGRGQVYALDLIQRNPETLLDTALLTFNTELFTFIDAQVNRDLSFTAGLRAYYLHLNQTYALSPSASMRWEFGNQALVGHAALAQEQLPWWVYLQGKDQQYNSNLPFMRSYQFLLGYHWRLAENWLVKLEGYYHYYDNIPAAADSTVTFLLPNMNLLAFDAELPALNPNASGYHSGLDLSVERFWQNNFYLKLNASVMDASYQMVDGRQFNANFNSRYYSALLAGKQFDFGPWGSNYFGIDARFIYSGGWFYTPVDEAASATANQTILDWDKAWSVQSPDFFSIDLRLRLSLNANRWNHELSLEGLNLLNVQAPNQYLFQNGSAGNWSPVGRAILLSYKVDFGWLKLKRN